MSGKLTDEPVPSVGVGLSNDRHVGVPGVKDGHLQQAALPLAPLGRNARHLGAGPEQFLCPAGGFTLGQAIHLEHLAGGLTGDGRRQAAGLAGG